MIALLEISKRFSTFNTWPSNQKLLNLTCLAPPRFLPQRVFEISLQRWKWFSWESKMKLGRVDTTGSKNENLMPPSVDRLKWYCLFSESSLPYLESVHSRSQLPLLICNRLQMKRRQQSLRINTNKKVQISDGLLTKWNRAFLNLSNGVTYFY